MVRNRANRNPGAATPLIPVVTVGDSDGDGIPDSVETTLGLNPNNSSDASGDLDGDSMSNYAETIAGTNPKDALSVLKVASSTTPGVFNITFRALAGHSYTIQYSDNLPVLVQARRCRRSDNRSGRNPDRYHG